MATDTTFFDLSTWYLTLPVDEGGTTSGSAATVKDLSDYQSDWFSFGSDGGLLFTVAVDGATTKGTKYARSELREMDGENLAWWNLADGGTMTGTLKVSDIQLTTEGGYGKVIVGQIHGKSQELVRLYWDNGSLYFKNDQAGPDDRELRFDLLNASGESAKVGLGEVFSYKIDARGDDLNVSVILDGEAYSNNSKINAIWNDDAFYFKAGAYLGQNETSASGAATVTFYGLDISHVEGEGLRGFVDPTGSNTETVSPATETVVTGDIVGDDGDNVLIGTDADDHIYGLDGDDAILARGGTDTMEGGKGNDRYYVDSADDIIIENAWEGMDTVHAICSITLSDNVENATLRLSRDIDATGNALGNRLVGNAGGNVLSGLDGDDVLNGEAGDDTLRGGEGIDYLFGGRGNDILEGGAGSDRYCFDTALDGDTNVDQIVGFIARERDVIMLSQDVFSGIGSTGRLNSANFRQGSEAQDADDRIIYDSATGNLFYDSDGTGDAAAVLFATLDPGTGLLNSNIYVY